MNIKRQYGDIIHLPHPTSSRHPRMSAMERAAQFSPFSALSGYSEAIKETARLTNEQMELSEDAVEELNEKLKVVEMAVGTTNCFQFIYFLPDQKKAGGAYVTKHGCVKKMDLYKKTITLCDQCIIPIDYLFDIQGTLIDQYGVDEW